MSEEVGNEEAYFRYKAIIHSNLRQLEGLEETTLRIHCTPSDAREAIQFWILPLLRGNLTFIKEHVFLYSPIHGMPNILIEFVAKNSTHKLNIFKSIQEEGLQEGYETVSIMANNCPDCGARWIRMAQMLAKQSGKYVEGWCSKKTLYLTTASKTVNTSYSLPTLNKVKSHSDWLKLLESPIGGRIKKNYNSIISLEK